MKKVMGVAIVAGLVVGCSALEADRSVALDEPTAERRSAAVSGPLVIRVINQRPQSMTIWAMQGTSRTLVGSVRGRGSAVFELPRAHVSNGSEFRLRADPRQSTLDQRSDLIDAREGQSIEWLLRRGGGDRIRIY